jgi:hypothetical protein
MQTIEQQIEQATNDMKDALLENVIASKAETEAQLRKKQAHFKLQKAQERLFALRSELMEVSYN